MSKTKEKEGAFDFEAGLKKLEALVASMESGDLPLQELVAKYEEGCKLVKSCEQRLKQAERKIEILREEANGEAKTEPFDPEGAS
ncbi:MAG: exodeoxyribonuclease VII small subunit [Opitutales bacterium]|nr:exodeoxyribonuclease VII small subunit [Opitutales bacterium]